MHEEKGLPWRSDRLAQFAGQESRHNAGEHQPAHGRLRTQLTPRTEGMEMGQRAADGRHQP
jgi:hypothetical protein